LWQCSDIDTKGL